MTVIYYSDYLIYGNDYMNNDLVLTALKDEKNYNNVLKAVSKSDIRDENFKAFAIDLVIHDIARGKDQRNSRLAYLTNMYGKDSPTIKYLMTENAKVKLYSLKAGDQAPSFYLEGLDGKYLDLEDKKGKLILLNFYSEGCIACIKEVPFEKELQLEY